MTDNPRFEAIKEALRDGPLSPDELRMVTGLSRHQIGSAVAKAIDEAKKDASRDVVVYNQANREWLIATTPAELAHAQIPYIKGQITRCSRILVMIDTVESLYGETPATRRNRSTLEAHLDQAQTILAVYQKILEEA